MSNYFPGSQQSDEEVEYRTISSTQSIREEGSDRLHDRLTLQQIEKLYAAFYQYPDAGLDFQDFRDLLEEVNISFSDFTYTRLFLKINQNRDFLVDWNEFVSFLIFGFQEDDPSSQKESLIMPISSPPIIRKTQHRSAVCCLTLLKAKSDQIPVEEDTEESSNIASGGEDTPEASGMWITASHEGQMRFWTSHLEPIRSASSDSIQLKMPTWLLAVQALSDVSIVCTSSTERELRFHETIASTFTLRIVIRSLPYAVYCMSYSFYTSGKVTSKLVLGDYGGNVRILSFDPYLRGPFQSKPGAALIEVVWTDVLKGKIPLFKPKEFINLHSEMVTTVYYSLRLNSLFASAEYRNTKKYRGRCPGLIVSYSEGKTLFRIPLGVTTFFVDEKHNLVVTGGPDTFVRIWDVYIPAEPTGILTGHNGGIVAVFIQPDENKVYSVDYHKIIKVWDLNEHTLLQTYGDLVRLIHPSETDLVYFYHSNLRELLVGGRKLIALKCCPRVRVDLTDGNTHAAPVSVVLYNRLFRNVVTCGLDSYIIVWDPWSGRRKIIMKSCHTKMVYGEIIDIEITAATFDPLEQFLLTGARDGSLKIWNYNNAVCVRNMSIKAEHEVTEVIWVVERILAVGWDRQVTEFDDVAGREYGDPKKWPTFHTDDITCADVKLGEGVVTATYSGEIIFWKLETGQPYRRYSVMDPTLFIELKHTGEEVPRVKKPTRTNTRLTLTHRTSAADNLRSVEMKFASRALRETRGADIRFGEQKKENITSISVQAVLFLQTRPMTKQHGSVFVSLDTGYIQAYSHHHRGGFIQEFLSVHKTGDCVLTMCTDRKNRYLLTGTAFGYIKIWYIVNFCVPQEEKQCVVMPLMRLQFIFLRKERFLTRAKRVVRNQPEPMLVSSYKGHLKAINSIAYINLPKIVLTGSHDYSCRLWTLGGRYLGTLGSVLPWTRLSPFEVIGNENRAYRMPPDIKKVASSTTMKVVSGIQVDRPRLGKTTMKAPDDEQKEETLDAGDIESRSIMDRPLREPILGKYFRLPGRGATEQRVDLDTSQSYIPVYSHLKVHPSEELARPPTPRVIKRVQAENYLTHYLPVTGKAVDPSSSAVNIKTIANRRSARRSDSLVNPTMRRGDYDSNRSSSKSST